MLCANLASSGESFSSNSRRRYQTRIQLDDTLCTRQGPLKLLLQFFDAEAIGSGLPKRSANCADRWDWGRDTLRGLEGRARPPVGRHRR
jgi:hypothetical protein